MKTILLTLISLVSFVSFSQNFKSETTLQSDGSITEIITISSDMLGAGVGLKAVVNGVDTMYFFYYRDQTYKTLVSYQTTQELSKEDVSNIIKMTNKVKSKEVDNANYSLIHLSRDMVGQIKFRGNVGFNYINIGVVEKRFNKFTQPLIN